MSETDQSPAARKSQAKGVSSLSEISEPLESSAFQALWDSGSAEDKKLFLVEQMPKIQDRGFATIVMLKISTDTDLPVAVKAEFAMEAAREYGDQFVRNNLISFGKIQKDVKGPWLREFSSVLNRVGFNGSRPSSLDDNKYSMKANLRESDLKTIFKLLPKAVKTPLSESSSQTEYLSHAVTEALSDLFKDKVQKLKSSLRKGAFVNLRWGDKSINDLGKSYLGVIVDERIDNAFVRVYMKKGVQRIPLLWVNQIYPADVLAPIKKWESLTPHIDEAHPALSGKWETLFSSGEFMPFDLPLNGVKALASSGYEDWVKSQADFIKQVKNLAEDQLLACQWKIEDLDFQLSEKKAEGFKSLKEGTWIEARDLGRCAFLGKADDGKARVWVPEDDYLSESGSGEYERAIFKIPFTWIKKTLSEQGLSKTADGMPSESDLLKHSKEFKRHHLSTQRVDLIKDMDSRSLRRLPSDFKSEDWPSFWNETRKVQSSNVKARGDKLLQSFHRWMASDQVKGASIESKLVFEKVHPLTIYLVTDLTSDGELLGSFVRADINLLEGTIHSKDSSVHLSLR